MFISNVVSYQVSFLEDFVVKTVGPQFAYLFSMAFEKKSFVQMIALASWLSHDGHL